MPTPHRLPNLFVVGAHKCGTTALSSYLATHPNIFMSETAGRKEPHYFSTDFSLAHLNPIRDRSTYLHLFDDAKPDHVYLGEASPSYLSSSVAVPALLALEPNARLVAMLRNPIELAQSHHNETTKYWNETLDFERAWRLQDRRSRGLDLPDNYHDGAGLQYGPGAKLGLQMQRLLEHARPEQVHVIVYDDFSKDAATCYAQLIEWLGLAPDARTDFPRLNPSRNYRSVGLEKTLRWIRRTRKSLHIPGGIGLNALIDRVNVVRRGAPLRPAFRKELQDYFREDVELLSNLLGRDFTHWLK